MRKSVVITGGNAGIGFEAAAQFAEAGFKRVTIVCRTEEKATDAAARLTARVGSGRFTPIGADVSRPSSVGIAADRLIAAAESIDVLILNAGVMPTLQPSITAEGYDIAYAATLVGHHVLTSRLLKAGVLAAGARIVVSGSEMARDKYPGMAAPDYRKAARDRFNGDLEAALQAYLRGELPRPRTVGSVYSMAKLMVAWWAAALSRTLPRGMTANAVSPGGAPSTGFWRNEMPGIQMMAQWMSAVGQMTGLMHSAATGARRYLAAAAFGDEVNGRFLASPPWRFTGPLVPVTTAEVQDRQAQDALAAILGMSPV